MSIHNSKSSDSENPTRHLDLGCGLLPRNPYHQAVLYACDIKDFREGVKDTEYFFRAADLSREDIPFEDNYFDSVSAFDFIEHIPRHAVDSNGHVILPFIKLMSEIHRVLRPGGIFLANTPAFPREEAFQDPTHVNIITKKTHQYFCGDNPYAVRYGFVGGFIEKRVAWDASANARDRKISPLRGAMRNIHRKFLGAGLTHLTWELIARK
jgi:SAM-dependent methyltransferase